MPSNSMAKLLINASRIKYSVLDELFTDIQIPNTTVNLFIDGHYLFYRLLKDSTSSDIYASEENEIVMEIVVAILNTLGHYRRYIATRLHRSNRIFLVMNRKLPKYQSSLIFRYGQDHFAQFETSHKDYGAINIALEKALEYVSGLIPYFEDIFMIDSSGVEEIVTMSYIMGCDEAQGDFHILYTRNEMAFQLLDDSCIMIFPKRDRSKIITHKNWADFITRSAKYEAPEIDTKYALIYLAIHGLKCRGIDSRYIRGTVNIIKAIHRLETDGNASDTVSLNTFLQAVSKLNKKERAPSEAEQESMNVIYQALSISSSIAALTDSQKARILSCIYNLYDQIGLEKLNDLLIQLDDVLEITNLNMNRVRSRESLWDYEEELLWQP